MKRPLALFVALAGLIAVLALIGAVVNTRATVSEVVVENDTGVAWQVCGDDCRRNEPVLAPGASAAVTSRADAEIFLVIDGRETDQCLFPEQRPWRHARVSHRRACVR